MIQLAVIDKGFFSWKDPLPPQNWIYINLIFISRYLYEIKSTSERSLLQTTKVFWVPPLWHVLAALMDGNKIHPTATQHFTYHVWSEMERTKIELLTPAFNKTERLHQTPFTPSIIRGISSLHKEIIHSQHIIITAIIHTHIQALIHRITSIKEEHFKSAHERI